MYFFEKNILPQFLASKTQIMRGRKLDPGRGTAFTFTQFRRPGLPPRAFPTNRLPPVAGLGWFKSMLSDPPKKPKTVLEVSEKAERLLFRPGYPRAFFLRRVEDSIQGHRREPPYAGGAFNAAPASGTGVDTIEGDAKGPLATPKSITLGTTCSP